MRIKRLRGELWRYHVSSRSEREWHTVDLSERDGHGVCTCHHFRFVAQKNFRSLNRDRPVGRQRCVPYGQDGCTECAHIALAQRVVTERFTKRLQAMCRVGVAGWIWRLWCGLTGDSLPAQLADEGHDGQEAHDDTYGE